MASADRVRRRRVPLEAVLVGAACLVCCLPLLGAVLAAVGGLFRGTRCRGHRSWPSRCSWCGYPRGRRHRRRLAVGSPHTANVSELWRAGVCLLT
jgi:hypothetical protein